MITAAPPPNVPMYPFRPAAQTDSLSDKTRVAVPMSVSLFSPVDRCRVIKVSRAHLANARSLPGPEA